MVWYGIRARKADSSRACRAGARALTLMDKASYNGGEASNAVDKGGRAS
jgi:hypothetical protein